MSARDINFATDPTEEELLRHWTLSKSDKAQVRSCRGTAQRYSFALQLCILRQRGHFMSPQQTRVPLRIVNHLGEQLGFKPTLFLPPIQREATWLEQQRRIRAYLEFNPFDQNERTALVVWLKQQERHDLKRSQLGNLTREFLLQRRTMLPAESTLERIVNTEVVRQEKLSFRRLSGLLSPALRQQIEGLILVDPATRISTLEWLTQYPPEASPPVIIEYMDRLNRLTTIGIDAVDLRDIRPSMLNYCTRLAERMTAYKLRRMQEDKRLALVFSLLLRTRQSLLDNLVEMHRTFLIGMNRRARRAVEQRERKVITRGTSDRF